MPAFEPPFDDELSPEVWASVHQLAFDWAGLTTQPQRPRPTGIERPTPGDTSAGLGRPPQGDTPAAPLLPSPGGTAARADTGVAGTGPADGGVAGTGPADTGAAGTGPADGGVAAACVAGASGEAKLAVRRFVAVCVEVLNGYRPAAHLRPLSVPGEAAGVVAEALAATRRLAEMRRTTGRTPRSTSRHGRRPDPVAVRRLRLCQPHARAVEAAVLLVTADRTWAVALRLERHQQSWAATTLRLV